MFFNKKLNADEMDVLKLKSKSLGKFATTIYSISNRLEQKITVINPDDTIVFDTFKQEKAELDFYIRDKLEPVIKKANKFLLKNGLNEVSYQKDEMFDDEEEPVFAMLRYYLSTLNIMDPLSYLNMVTVKKFNFCKTLNKFEIREEGVKIHILSYYYVSDENEKRKLNELYHEADSKYYQLKIEQIYKDYVMRKISGVSFDMKETRPLNFYFDLYNFKDVLNRIKYNVDNVVNLR